MNQEIKLTLIPCEARAVLRLIQRNGDGLIEMAGATPSTFANIAAKIEAANQIFGEVSKAEIERIENDPNVRCGCEDYPCCGH